VDPEPNLAAGKIREIAEIGDRGRGENGNGEEKGEQ